MEEDQEERAIDTKCLRKLNYNAPLLSTRRPSGATSLQLSRTNSQGPWQDTCNRVPFSWEQNPGKPKDSEKNDTDDDMAVPPPKLPPGRWHPQKEAIKVDNIDQCQEDDVFSDAIDMFSLSESTDMLETFNEFTRLGGVNSEIEECSGAQSPSFIIQRFLTDANALALSKNLNNKLPHSSNYRNECANSQPVRQSYASSQGCGFGIVFPWRMKHKPCGLKNPVRQPSQNAKPQWNARRKQKP